MLAPLVVGVLTVVPVAGLFTLDFMLSVRFGGHSILPNMSQLHSLGQEMLAKGIPVDQPSFGHLWFLYYLCMFYVLIPFCQFVVQRSLPFQAGLRRFLLSHWSLPVLSLLTTATLWPFRGAQVHEGFFVHQTGRSFIAVLRFVLCAGLCVPLLP